MSAKHAMQHDMDAGTQVEGRRIWWAGLLTMGAAVVVNLLALLLVQAVVDVPATFLALRAGPIAVFTTLGVGLGVLTYAILVRLTRAPIRVFLFVAAFALLVSCIPNMALMINPSAAPIPGGTSAGFGALIVFHILAAAITMWVLPTLTQQKHVGRKR